MLPKLIPKTSYQLYNYQIDELKLKENKSSLNKIKIPYQINERIKLK